MVDPEAPAVPGIRSTSGVVREVVYVGDVTRFVVELDAGGQLVALQQNLETSSSDVLAFRGRRVVLAWRPDHEFAVVSAAGIPPAGGV